MVVRIRLALHGSRNNPFYHIVAIRDKAARDALPIEKLGEYDPIPRPRQSPNTPVQAWNQVGVASSSTASSSKIQFDKPILTSGLEDANAEKLEKRIEWNVKRINYWLSVGAQPSKPIARLLDRAGLIPEGKWYKGMYKPPMEDGQQGGSEILKEAAKKRSDSPFTTATGQQSTLIESEQTTGTQTTDTAR